MCPSSRFHVLRRGLRRGVGACLVLAAAFWGLPASSAVNITGLSDLDLGTWTPGAGGAFASDEFCVQSDLFGFFVIDFAARLDDLSGASTSTEYRIPHTGGAGTLPIQVRLVDLRDGSAHTLEPGVVTPGDYRGDTARCPRGLNARLEVRIASTDLGAAAAGRFEGTFDLLAGRFGTDVETLAIRIDVPDLVRISGLDDLALGAYGGGGDLTAADGLCVYRNDPSTQYEIAGTGQGAGSGFVVEQGVDSMAFEVEYDDGSGYVPLTPGVARSVRGADDGATDCGGLSNASVRVTVREAELAGADAGSYAGTLRLTVAPI